MREEQAEYKIGEVVYVARLNEIVKTKIFRIKKDETINSTNTRYFIEFGPANSEYDISQIFKTETQAREMYKQQAKDYYQEELKRIDNLPVKE